MFVMNRFVAATCSMFLKIDVDVFESFAHFFCEVAPHVQVIVPLVLLQNLGRFVYLTYICFSKAKL